jgi:hypothetical protein
MKTTTHIFKTLMFILVMTVNGCLEHTYQITVLPEDNIEIQYSARGDRMDLEDGFDLFPDSLQWGLVRTVEENEDETVHILTGTQNFTGLLELEELMNWWTISQDTVKVRRGFSLHRESSLFGESIVFIAVFQSRNFDDRYGDIWEFVPEECRILEDDDLKGTLASEEVDLLEEKFSLGVLQWNLARYEKRFLEAWQLLKIRDKSILDTSETTFSIVRAGWSDDVRLYVNELDVDDPNTMNLEWWEDLRPIFLGRLVDIAGISSADLISRIAKDLEIEYQVSKDIDDDNFKVKLSLPGRITDSNGESTEDGFITWEIPGEELKNADYFIHAKGFEFNFLRISLAAFVSLLILRWIKILVWKKKRTQPNE